MILICLTSIILPVLLNFFSLLQVTGACNHDKIVCNVTHPNSTQQIWCCRTNQICGKNFDECDFIPNFRPYTYLMIILSIIIITIFFGRCIMICLSFRHEQNENLSIDIYHSIAITHSNIPIDEESPPSYEEVMSNNSPYRLDDLG